MDEINEQAGTAIGSGDGRLFVAPAPEDLNQVLPNFEVECLIGQGGMGAVYKARQPKLDRFVAIKVVPALFRKSEHNFAERFEREARAMAGLNHPHIVTVHDFGETENGYLYIVMEYVDGRDMHHAIVSGQAGVNEALAWMIQLCEAIQYAHEHDVVHRDIKPANILINREGQVKVGDFGLVKLVGRKLETSITLSQVAMGTPDYSAPESLEEGGTVDHRADVYSLGVLLYELLTGKVPRGAWQPPSAFVPVNPRLDQIVVKAMQPDPEQRYQSAAQLREAVQAVCEAGAAAPEKPGAHAAVAGEAAATAKGVTVRPDGMVKKRRRHGRPILQAMVALLIIALTVGAVLLLATRTEALRLLTSQRAGPAPPPLPAVPPPQASGAAEAAAERERASSADVPQLIRVEKGWVDVVPSLSFPRDLVSGRWRVQGKTLRPVIQRDSDRSRLRVPVLLETSYEVALEVVYRNGVFPFVLTLPLRVGPVSLLVGEAGLPDEPRFLAIGGTGTLRNGQGEATRRFPVKLSSSGPHSFAVKVLNRKEDVAIVVTVDGEETGRFLGALSDFSQSGEKPGVVNGQIVLGAAGDLEIRDFRVRSLPAKEWLREAAGAALPASQVAQAESKPEPVPEAESAPQMGEQEKSWTDAVRQRLVELAATHEKREWDFARAGYEAEVATLREKYNAALNRANQESSSISVKAAVQRELMRIREGERIEATDPPEMPEIVRKARAIFRQELSKLDEELNLALAPMLREQIESLSALENERKASGQYPEAARVLVVEARTRVEQRLEEVRAFLGELEKARKAAAANGSSEADMTQSGERKAEPGSLVGSESQAVPRRERLSAESRPRGRIEVWPRLEPAREPAARFEWKEVPSGLGNTVVAVTGAPGVVAALKSNGRVGIWGAMVSEELQERVSRIDGVADVSVGAVRNWIGLGFLMKDGSARFYPELAGAPGDVALGPVSDLVEVKVVPEGGVGLRQTGELMTWGNVPAAEPEASGGIARIQVHGPRLIALRTDGTLLSLVGGKPEGSELWPEGPFREIAVGTQPQFGMVAQRTDGGLVALGSFASLEPALQTYALDHKVVRLIGGYEAFAVQDERGEWAFFGTSLDAPRLAEAARGCRDLVIGRDEVIGLQTM